MGWKFLNYCFCRQLIWLSFLWTQRSCSVIVFNALVMYVWLNVCVEHCNFILHSINLLHFVFDTSLFVNILPLLLEVAHLVKLIPSILYFDLLCSA